MNTYENLINSGYRIENARIESVSLNFFSHGCLTLEIQLQGHGWIVSFGGYCLGKGYLNCDADKFKGDAKGEEAIMQIMNTVGVEDLYDCVGKYIRVALKEWNDPIKIIGNIIDDKWFNYESFFNEESVK